MFIHDCSLSDEVGTIIFNWSPFEIVLLGILTQFIVIIFFLIKRKKKIQNLKPFILLEGTFIRILINLYSFDQGNTKIIYSIFVGIYTLCLLGLRIKEKLQLKKSKSIKNFNQ